MQTVQQWKHGSIEMAAETAMGRELMLKPGDRIKMLAEGNEESAVAALAANAIGVAIELAFSEAEEHDLVAVEHAGHVFGCALRQSIQNSIGLCDLASAGRFMKGFDRAWVVVQ